MKKIIVFLITAVLTVTMLNGCGNTRPNIDTDNYEVNLNIDKNIQAEISILIPSGNTNEQTMIDSLIAGFNEIYPNVNIEISYVSVNTYENNIKNLAGTGTLNDIVWSNSPDFYYLVDKNLVLNLNPYINASETANVFNFEEDFYKIFFDCGSLNGKLYTIPRSADSVVTFINKEILTAAGVDLNIETTVVKNGWTWDEFLSVCAKVRTYLDNNGKSTAYVLDANLTSWLSVCYPMLSAYGGDVVDDNGNIVINSNQAKECIEMVRYMVEQRYICDSRNSSGSSYEAGTSAMLFQSASVSLFADRKALLGKADVVSFPLITNNNTPKIGCGIAGYAINKETAYKDICWAFLNYMLSYDGQQIMALNGLNLPSIRKDLADYKTANWGKGYETLNLGAYLYGMEYKIDTQFLSKVDTKYKVDLTQALKDLFNNASNASKTIDDCLTTALRDCNDAIGA
jgi:ABC-type glycerol-3-phosphate transport system substrate-binding protein